MPMIDMIKTGDNIVAFRKKMKMTVKDVQNIFGFGTPNAIYKWENGVSMPTIDNLIILANVFGCKIDDIIATKQLK